MSEKQKNVQIPADLFVALRDAVRATERDSRRTDRALHDVTRDLVTKANDALNTWQDRKVAGR